MGNNNTCKRTRQPQIKKTLSESLPEDLMIEIIVRLPVRSMFRFKCVAKSWYALITDPSFITKQFEWSNSIVNNRRLKLIFQSHYPNLPPSISLISNTDQPFVVQDLELPFPSNNLKWISVYGHCNGIFCLCGVYEGGFRGLILWNPATKEVKPIPASQCQPKGIYYINFGFGFDLTTKDYKIVRFPFFPLGQEKPLVEVYNLSTNSWRTINVDVPIFYWYYRYGGSYFNGAYHWLTGDPHHTIDKFIVSFDFSKEVFGIIRGPPNNITSSCFENLLAVVGENLACVATYFSNPEFHIDIWVMNEYGAESSWTKKFKIGPFPNFTCILGFWGDNEILIDQDSDQLILYDLRNQQIQRLQIQFQKATMIDYVESLFPLGGKGKHKKI